MPISLHDSSYLSLAELSLAVQRSSDPLRRIVPVGSSPLFVKLISFRVLKISFSNSSNVALQTCKVHMEAGDPSIGVNA